MQTRRGSSEWGEGTRGAQVRAQVRKHRHLLHGIRLPRYGEPDGSGLTLPGPVRDVRDECASCSRRGKCRASTLARLNSRLACASAASVPSARDPLGSSVSFSFSLSPHLHPSLLFSPLHDFPCACGRLLDVSRCCAKAVVASHRSGFRRGYHRHRVVST